MRQVTLNRVKQEHEKQKLDRQQTMNLLLRKDVGGRGQQHKEALKQLFDKISALGAEDTEEQKATLPHSHSQKSLPSRGLLATQQSSEAPIPPAGERRDGQTQSNEQRGPALQRGQTYLSKNSEKVLWQIETAFRELAKETELQVGSVFKAQDKFRAEIDTNQHSWMRRLGVHKLNDLAKELFKQEIQSERFDEVNLKQFDFTSLASKYNKERRASRRPSKQVI